MLDDDPTLPENLLKSSCIYNSETFFRVLDPLVPVVVPLPLGLGRRPSGRLILEVMALGRQSSVESSEPDCMPCPLKRLLGSVEGHRCHENARESLIAADFVVCDVEQTMFAYV